MAMDLIIEAKAKRLKEAFGNLAKLCIEKMHQELVGNNFENKQSKNMLLANWH